MKISRKKLDPSIEVKVEKVDGETEPTLPNDGRPQPEKGANIDVKTWKTAKMSNDPSLWKVVDDKNINVADQFHSEANAQQYIDFYKSHPINGGFGGRAVVVGGATYLPQGYPVYCIYVPTGMNPEPESMVLAKLKEWGKTMGSNLLVAPWDIGDISYGELVQKLEINQVPSLILTDSNLPDKNSLLIKIDDPADVNNVERLVEILPPLVNHILARNSKMALMYAITDRRNSKVKSFLKPISSTLKRIKKLKISADGFEIELS